VTVAGVLYALPAGFSPSGAGHSGKMGFVGRSDEGPSRLFVGSLTEHRYSGGLGGQPVGPVL
jgi:hypothetical protein